MMKKLIFLAFIICYFSINVKAQKLKNARSRSSKTIERNMFASSDYKKLQKLLVINDKEAALKLTSYLSINHRTNKAYASTLNLITANIYYASKDYTTAYTHYILALPPVKGVEFQKILQDAANRCLYQADRVEKEKLDKKKKIRLFPSKKIHLVEL